MLQSTEDNLPFGLRWFFSDDNQQSELKSYGRMNRNVKTRHILTFLLTFLCVHSQIFAADEITAELKTEGRVDSYGYYYTGKFNQNTYMSFLHKETWTTDIFQVAMRLAGANAAECKSLIIEVVKPSVENSDSQIVMVSMDGLMDDSVRAKKFKLRMKKREGGWWEVSFAEQAQSCWPEKGHQEFSGDACK